METSLNAEEAEKNGRIAKTIGYYIAFIALGLTSASLGPTILGLSENTRTSISQISFLFTARSLGYLFGSMLGGRLYDRLPGHRVQVVALLFMAAMMALVPVLPLIGLLVVVLIVLGFAEATLDVGGNTLLIWVHRERVAPYMNGLHLFFGVGAFLSPIIIAQAVLMTGNTLSAYWVLAVLLIPVILLMSRLPSPPIMKENQQEGQQEAAQYGLVFLIMLFFFLNVGAEGSFSGWVFTYAKALNLATDVNAAYLTSAFWGGLMAGRLIAIPISTRVQPHWMLLADLLGCVASLALIILMPPSYAIALVAAFGAGFFMASVFPTTMNFAGLHMPIYGRITGLFLVGASAGSMFMPWLIGQLFETVGPGSAMVVIFAALVSALLLFGVIMVAIRRKEAK
jgi:MFS transporter, FHS family, Na+ dependent glucose transporter 1